MLFWMYCLTARLFYRRLAMFGLPMSKGFLKDLQTALPSEIDDYEDAVQVIQALAAKVDVIVTRDVRDFANSPIRVLSPAEFVKGLVP